MMRQLGTRSGCCQGMCYQLLLPLLVLPLARGASGSSTHGQLAKEGVISALASVQGKVEVPCTVKFCHRALASEEAVLLQTPRGRRSLSEAAGPRAEPQAAARSGAGAVSTAVDAEGTAATGTPKTLRAVQGLALQYFLVHTLAAMAKSANRLRGGDRGPFERVLESALAPIGFTPMLCVLFLAAWLQGVCASQDPDPMRANVRLPMGWMEWIMIFLTITLISKTILHLAVGSIVAHLVNGEAGDAPSLPKADELENGEAGGPLETVACSGIAVMMYGSIIALVGGELGIPRPQNQVLDPAVQCTLLLASQYFGVTLAMQLASACAPGLGRRSMCLPIATGTLRQAPMACALLQAIRLHVMHESLLSQSPLDETPARIRSTMQLASLALFLAIFAHVGAAPGAAEASAGDTADVSLQGPGRRPCVAGVVSLLLLAFYASAFWSFFAAVWEARSAHQPQVLPEVSCTAIAATVYFGIHLTLHLAGLNSWLSYAGDALRDASLPFPMVSALLLSKRWAALRGQQVEAYGKGMELQRGWVGNIGYVVLWASIFQLAVVAGAAARPQPGTSRCSAAISCLELFAQVLVFASILALVATSAH